MACCMKFVFATNRTRQAEMMGVAAKAIKVNGSEGEFSSLAVETEDCISRQELAALNEADFVLIVWMGFSDDVVFLKKGIKLLQKNKTPYVILDSELSPEEAMHRVSPVQYEQIRQYVLYSGTVNQQNLWLYLAQEFAGGTPQAEPPVHLCWNGIFHPAAPEIFGEAAAYRKQHCLPGRFTVGILFSREEWLWGDLAAQRALIDEIEHQQMNVIAVFSQWSKNEEAQVPGVAEAVQSLFYEDGQPNIDVLINTFKFSLTSGNPAEQQFLLALNRPILQAYGLLSTEKEWRRSSVGMTPMEISFSMAMPEFDGVIHSVPISVKEQGEDGINRYLPLKDRLPLLVRKAKKWAALRHKKNANKKIAVIFHNYPSTNASIGSAQGLDSPESIRLLLEHMREAGYRVNYIPDDSKAFMDELLTYVTNDRRFLNQRQLEAAAGKIPAQEYQEFFNGLPEKNQIQLEEDWGKAPGEVFVYDDQLLVPGRMNGNIFITMQPPRGFGEDPGKILHNPDCAPTHHYLAYYHWIRDIWQADAVIHVGTHGSLEWLPGKGAGLSAECYPELALGDLPNVYPYLLTIVGEGIQAKRRGAASLIGHLPPPMSEAGMYDELAELEKLLDEYVHFKEYEMPGMEKTAELIVAKANELHFTENLAARPDDDFAAYIQALHIYLTDLKNMQIRVGLHILGCPPSADNLVDYLLALVRMDNGDIPSLPKTLAKSMGYDYYTLLGTSAEIAAGRQVTNGVVVDEIMQHCKVLLGTLFDADFTPEAMREVEKLSFVHTAGTADKDDILRICRYICEVLAINLQKTRQEITNLLKALDGGFVEPGPAGAPTSGCSDILPTGRNFYGIDPNTLPSKAAWEIGKTLGDEVIARFVKEEGRYPETVGIVLWSGSNMRSHGQCVAEFLYLMGVRPIWQSGSMRVAGLEIIPLAQLKRPRIDVTARISGLFRDTLPSAVLWMDKAVRMVADLPEELSQNYIKKHVVEDKVLLAESGETDDEQVYFRVFGCPPGSYGAGVGAMLEAKNWESVDDLAAVYVRWGAHAYGEKETGSFVPENFKRRLQTIDVTVKNEDNREVHMMNSDDFNAYHGGMIAAVRSLKGSAPRSYCGDSSDRAHVVLRSLDEEVKRLFRGETMNPKYIKGMQKHGYKGASDLAATVAHYYEWDATSQVVDDWMYDGLAEKYALDEQMQAWMKEVNPWALSRIAEKLLEAVQRGMWQPADETKEALRGIYLSVEGELEERSDGDGGE